MNLGAVLTRDQEGSPVGAERSCVRVEEARRRRIDGCRPLTGAGVDDVHDVQTDHSELISAWADGDALRWDLVARKDEVRTSGGPDAVDVPVLDGTLLAQDVGVARLAVERGGDRTPGHRRERNRVCRRGRRTPRPPRPSSSSSWVRRDLCGRFSPGRPPARLPHRERERRDRRLAATLRPEQTAVGHPPQPYRPIVAPDGERLAAGREGHRFNPARPAEKGPQAGRLERVPERVHRLRGSCAPDALRGERDRLFRIARQQRPRAHRKLPGLGESRLMSRLLALQECEHRKRDRDHRHTRRDADCAALASGRGAPRRDDELALELGGRSARGRGPREPILGRSQLAPRKSGLARRPPSSQAFARTRIRVCWRTISMSVSSA